MACNFNYATETPRQPVDSVEDLYLAAFRVFPRFRQFFNYFKVRCCSVVVSVGALR